MKKLTFVATDRIKHQDPKFIGEKTTVLSELSDNTRLFEPVSAQSERELVKDMVQMSKVHFSKCSVIAFVLVGYEKIYLFDKRISGCKKDECSTKKCACIKTIPDTSFSSLVSKLHPMIKYSFEHFQE